MFAQRPGVPQTASGRTIPCFHRLADADTPRGPLSISELPTRHKDRVGRLRLRFHTEFDRDGWDARKGTMMIDANEWVVRATAFDAAKDELLRLAQMAQEQSENLIANWYNFHPSDRPSLSNHRSGRTNFDVEAWPSGAQINDALGRCHQAYLTLKEGFEELPENARKAFKLDVPPVP